VQIVEKGFQIPDPVRDAGDPVGHIVDALLA